MTFKVSFNWMTNDPQPSVKMCIYVFKYIFVRTKHAWNIKIRMLSLKKNTGKKLSKSEKNWGGGRMGNKSLILNSPCIIVYFLVVKSTMQ